MVTADSFDKSFAHLGREGFTAGFGQAANLDKTLQVSVARLNARTLDPEAALAGQMWADNVAVLFSRALEA